MAIGRWMDGSMREGFAVLAREILTVEGRNWCCCPIQIQRKKKKGMAHGRRVGAAACQEMSGHINYGGASGDQV